MNSPLIVLTSNTAWYLFNFRKSTILALMQKGFRVVCLSPMDHYSDRLRELGAEHIPLPLDGKSTGAVQELRSFIFIWKFMRRHKPEFVFNFTVKMNIYSGLVCAALRIPYANNISGLGTAFIHDSWLFRRVRQIYGLVNKRASHLFFQNDDDLSIFERSGLLSTTPVTLLPGSGVDLGRFQASPLPTGGPITFLMIARLLGDKGVREYAQAAKLLKEQGADVHCQLVGQLGVSNRTAISEEEVSAWQAKGWIDYLGETDDVRPFIQQCHALVLPSYREGIPRTVLEASAMGRPAIVTDVPGCRHAVNPNVTGWLCEARDSRSLAQMMNHFIDLEPSDRQKAGDAAREMMEERFSEELVVEAYLNCLGIR